MRYLPSILLALCLAPMGCRGEDKDKEKARTKPIEASNFEDIIVNFGYALDGVERVVWILDQSPSMEDDIAEVRKRIDDWFKNIDPGTQVGVILFSLKPQVLQPLTKDRAAIKAAFEKYKTQDAGQENVYAAIAEALKMLPGKEKSAILVATDEAGDDDKFLATALRECAGRSLQFYALTPQASFGNKIWKWSEDNYKAKDTKFYRSNNGPESFSPEALFNFHFVQRTNWHPHNYFEDTRIWAMDSGWAPFGLQVLTEATHGRIYELKTDTCKLSTVFDEKSMPRYAPDRDAPNILRNIQRTPWRLAVQQVSEYWSKNFKDMERCMVGSGRNALLAGCARIIPVVQANMRVADAALDQLATALKNKQGFRSADDSADSVPHLRWRANLELAYASASVARFHLNQILVDIARFKDPKYEPPTQPGGSAEYVLNCVPDAKTAFETLAGAPDAQGFYEMLASAEHAPARTLEQIRKQAETALAVVMANHKDTPWAAMAAQLKTMLGFYDPIAIPIGPWTHGNSNK